VWSVLLDGDPVRPLTEGGELLVPLGRGAASRAPRIVEFVTSSPIEPLADKERQAKQATYAMPVLPLPATAVSWQVWLPQGWKYKVRGGTLAEAVPLAAVDSEVAEVSTRHGWFAKHKAVAPSPPANAEYTTGKPGVETIAGTVTDDQGGVLPGVQIEIREEATGTKHFATTDNRGQFRVTRVAPGLVRVVARLAGFNEVERSVRLPVGQTASVALEMSIGATSELMVTGSAPGSAGMVAEERDADRVPSSRDYQETLALSPGGQSAMISGVASIPVDLPQSGKVIRLAGHLLVGEAATVELDLRPEKRAKTKQPRSEE
jgi:hypothetical protein